MEKNKLGFWSIVLLGINGIIGSGIFLLPNKAMALIGPASLLVMIFDMFLVLAITFCFAEASGLFKDNGGAYIYAKKAFGNFFGYEVGFLSWMTRIIAYATMSVGFATALAGVFPSLGTPLMKDIIVTVILVLLAIVNLLGLELYKIVQNAATIAKIIPFILFIGMGIFYIQPANFEPFFPGGTYTPGTFGAAAVMLFFAFTGFESIAIAAAEMENPQKNLPKATLVTIFIVSAIYLLLLTCAIGIMGYGLADTKAPVQEAFGRIAGTFGTTIVAAGTLVSIGGLCIGSSFITPHSCLALAQKQMMPAFMARENRFGAPHWCIIISTLIAMLIAYTGSFTFLASISVVSRFSQYIPTCLAILVFRKTMADTPRAFRIPFGPVIPVIAVLVSLWLLSQATFQQIAMGLGAAVIAVPFYWFIRKNQTEE
jgi:amino acid transporter